LLTRDRGTGAVAIVLNVVPKTLSNGLRVLVLELPHLHAVSHALLVRTGPRYESPADNGISHLVEHLVFRGTIDHPDSYALNVAVESLGGEINGLTQRDATTIHLTVPPRSAAPSLMLLGEICTRPTLSGIEVERDVVMEELLDTLDASGCELDVDVLSRRVLWNAHGIGLPIAGTPATVEAMTEAQCRAHFEKTFVAENAALCIAGPVSVEEMLEVAERAFGRMPRGTPLAELPPPVPPVRAPIQVQAMDDSQVTAMLTYPAPHENHADFAALLLLKRVLDDGLGSRLRQAVCEQRGLAYSLSASIDAYSDVGALDVELACAPRKLVSAIEATLATLQQLAGAPIGEAELERAKIRHRAELEFALDDPSEMCGWYGAMELVRCRSSYEERLAEVMRVSCADIQALAQRILDPTLAILTLVGPAEESDVHRLELLLGREAQSTAWLNDGVEVEDDEDDYAAAS
jgi:predicted Zn-dependent peptidase